MNNIFLSVVDMSITAALIVPVILLVRFLIRGAPRKYSYFLWSVVAFRLCCPVSIESRLSIFNLFVKRESKAPVYNATYTEAALEAQKTVSITDILCLIWLCGMAALLLYGIISYILVKNRVHTAVRDVDNVFCAEGISTPFILGFLSPKIYIPYGVDENTKEYILTHERYHLKRFDHIVKPIAFSILALHWFNPLCWISFMLMSRDMELSCDEKVLSLGALTTKYSAALLSFAVNKPFPAPAPLAFGEVSVKTRIKKILKWKKPALGICIMAALLCITVVTVCVCNAEEAEGTEEQAISQSVKKTKALSSKATEALETDMVESSVPETEASESEIAETGPIPEETEPLDTAAPSEGTSYYNDSNYYSEPEEKIVFEYEPPKPPDLYEDDDFTLFDNSPRDTQGQAPTIVIFPEPNSEYSVPGVYW